MMVLHNRLSTVALISIIALSGVLTLSACSQSPSGNATGVDPAPGSMAGNQATGEYADSAGVVHQGEPNSQVDPYTGSTVNENYAGRHEIAPEQTVGDRLQMAKEDLKEAGRAVKENVKDASHAAGENLKQAGEETKAAGRRMKNEMNEEFNNN
ncbi:MAG: hypothetical protein VKJ04_02500 [Vampirovibrionales bacterium]|nr:hypothetical protein [Vampirovibrionales bacterium]